MKKIYQAPVTEEIKIAFKQQMLADSLLINNGDASTDGNGDYDDSRSIDSFFFDDDEDY